MDSKTCSKCGKTKLLTDFYRESRKKSGYACQCKECRRQGDKKYYKTHKTHVLEQANNYRIKRWARNKATNSLGYHRRLGHEILVSIDYVEQLFLNTKVCSICGKYLKCELGNSRKALHDSGSLDRIDNDTNLTEDNIWVICFECNTMKGTKSLRELQIQCDKMSERIEEILNDKRR